MVSPLRGVWVIVRRAATAGVPWTIVIKFGLDGETDTVKFTGLVIVNEITAPEDEADIPACLKAALITGTSAEASPAAVLSPGFTVYGTLTACPVCPVG